MNTVGSPPPRQIDRRPARSIVPLALCGLLLALALLGAGLFLWLRGSPAASIGGPFRLTDQSGQSVSDKGFRGKYMLVYFGYTYCPDVCPTTLNEVAGALNRLGPKADRIAPIFITVDPQRDTPEVLKQYVSAFSPRLIGLTGTPDEIDRVEREYHVYAAKHVTGPGPNDYTMDHSSFLYLMGPDGRFITPIGADTPAPELASQLNKLVP